MAARQWRVRNTDEIRKAFGPEHVMEPTATPSAASVKAIVIQRAEETSTLPTEIVIPTQSASITIEPTLALAPTTTSSDAGQVLVQPETATGTPQSTATTEPNSEGGDGEMSIAAKAGIVIGVLGGILIVFVLVWAIVNSRKKKLARRKQQIEDDEKINGPFADSAAIRAPPAAPRLSLRPVTQFLPSFNSTNHTERRASRGIALTLNPVSAPSPTTSLSPLARPAGGSAWERPTLNSTRGSPSPHGDRPETSNSLHPNNPFNDGQRIPDNEPVSPISSLSSFDNRAGVATTTDGMPEPVSPIDGEDGFEAVTTAAASSITRKASIRKDLPKPLDLTKPPSPLYAVPPSPAGTEYSMHSMAPGQTPGPSASAAAIAAAGGPSQSTVHRVQLDFKPTLADELELRAGQLVRLLHEYDDGWALCIRLDRSQQGVVPRTCLSTRPVKPRPAQTGPGSGNSRGGPPVNPSYHHHQQTGSNASGRYGRPHSPSGWPQVPYGSGGARRPVSPAGGGSGPRYHPQSGGRRSPSGQGQGQQQQQQQQFRGYGYDSGSTSSWPPPARDLSPGGPAPGQAY